LGKLREVKSDGWRIWCDSDCGLDVKEILDIALADGSQSKVASSKYANVFVREHNLDGEKCRLYVKQYLERNFTDGLKHILRKDRASRGAMGNIILGENGFNVAENIAWGFKKNSLLKKNCFLITKEIANTKPLPDVVEDLSEDAQNRENLLKQLAGTVGRMHRVGIYHGDMRAGNVLIKENAGRFEFYFLDNERTKKYLYLPEKLILYWQRKPIIERCLIVNFAQLLMPDFALDRKPIL